MRSGMTRLDNQVAHGVAMYVDFAAEMADVLPQEGPAAEFRHRMRRAAARDAPPRLPSTAVSRHATPCVPRHTGNY